MNDDLDLICVKDVEYLHDFTMLLTFSNGHKRVVDFLPLLTKKIHEPLREHKNFIQFALTEWTLEWYNGVDFAPDYLYRNGQEAA